jgi:ketohexokinase
MSKILAVGIATIDIINEVTSYPKEDSEVRAINQRCQRGGNATNTLVVLSQFGHNCSWAGTWADDSNASVILNNLDFYRIDYSNSTCLKQATNPTSYILHSYDNASRSIVHYRDLAEYSFDDFKQIDLQSFDWIHFEGRNIENVYLMLKHCKSNYPKIQISLEVEKIRPDINKLFQYADVLLFSKPFVIESGYSSAKDFFMQQQGKLRSKLLSCTWGEDGAKLFYKGNLYSSNPNESDNIIDTLAAGDTYNAALIHALSQNRERNKELSTDIANECLQFASEFASLICTQKGIQFDTQFVNQT